MLRLGPFLPTLGNSVGLPDLLRLVLQRRGACGGGSGGGYGSESGQCHGSGIEVRRKTGNDRYHTEVEDDDAKVLSSLSLSLSLPLSLTELCFVVPFLCSLDFRSVLNLDKEISETQRFAQLL